MPKKLEIRKMGDSIHYVEGHGADVDLKNVYRCTNCNTVGCKGSIGSGTLIEIQCRRCKTKYAIKGI